MKTRQAPLKTSPLMEDVARTRTPLKVDREAGVIHHVKILGWDSINRRRYSPEAARKAVSEGLYEGAKSFWDHPTKENAHLSRSTDDALGVFRNVVWEPGGVYGDLHYFRADERTMRLCEDCERGMGFFGMSHHIGPGDYLSEMDSAGLMTITEIRSVKSVDCVTDSATVANLWEGRQPAVTRIKVKDLFESLSLDKRVPRPVRFRLNTLLEGDGMGGPEMDADVAAPPAMEDPAADMDHNAILQSGFKAAITKLLDEDMDDKALMKRVQELLKAKSGLLGKPADAPADDSADEPLDEECDDDKAMKESITRLTRTNEALTWLIEGGVNKPLPAHQLNALCLMESEQDRRAIVHDHKINNQANTPRSQGRQPPPATDAKPQQWVHAN